MGPSNQALHGSNDMSLYYALRIQEEIGIGATAVVYEFGLSQPVLLSSSRCHTGAALPKVALRRPI